MHDAPFTRAEAVALWSRLVSGWAHALDESGARTLLDGIPNGADAGGSYEGVTRMLWGLGGWLSRPERPTTLRWRGETFDIAALLRRALIAGCDPASPGYWGRPALRGSYDQRTVEAGQVAFAAWQSRRQVWEQLSVQERAHVVAFLEGFSRRPEAWRNNWALFWLLNHASRKALGAPHDQALMDDVLAYLDRAYCGDGWYDDGPARGSGHFDDYNAWVFGTHVLAWAQADGASRPGRRDVLLERVRRQMRHLPYFFAADGGYPHYGRSLAYKFARLGAPLWAYHLGAWPHPVGLLRRLVGRHLRWYVDRGALRPDDTLRQALTAGGSPEIRETYISTGAPYWAMLAFGALWSLPDDDPFWSDAEEPLPVEQDDFVHVLPEPGWLLVGTRAGGQVQRFVASSNGHGAAKYQKFLYATAAPFNVGLVDGTPAPDGMLCLTDGRQVGHREGGGVAAVGEPGWLRMRHQQSIAGRHRVDTTIVVRGDWHLRAHRVTLDPAAGPIGAVEGTAPLGYPSGSVPFVRSDEGAGWELASVPGSSVAIVRLRGYDGQRPATAWHSRDDLNSVHDHMLLPLLEVRRLSPEHELLCLVYTGTAVPDIAAAIAGIRQADWLADGSFRMEWADGSVVAVPALPEGPA